MKYRDSKRSSIIAHYDKSEQSIMVISATCAEHARA